ncbi:MAG: hypothetical protein KUG65_06065 [Sphingomonadaceae bacterium]|nr:hypothetical protein [Sphingomonadaceae bacterium]
MALAADRNTPRREGGLEGHPVKAATQIFAGALVCLDAAGWLVPGSVSTTLKALGRADKHVDNSAGANGDLTAPVRRGVFHWKNSAAADEITRAEIGDTAYIVDDETVAKTDGTASRSAAGIIIDVDAQGVWIES